MITLVQPVNKNVWVTRVLIVPCIQLGHRNFLHLIRPDLSQLSQEIVVLKQSPLGIYPKVDAIRQLPQAIILFFIDMSLPN